MTGRGRSRGTPGLHHADEAQPRTGAGRGRPQQTPLAPVPTQPAPAPFVPPASRGSGESKGRGRPHVVVQQPPPQQSAEPPQAPASRGGNGGNGGGVGKVDRGSVRARNIITDIIQTKPQNIQSKKGTSGQPVALLTNHFRLLKQPNWQLYQYRVDFSPQIELRGLRNRLIYEQKPTLGGYLFDGTMLFLSVKLPNEVTEFMSKNREGEPIQTTVKYINPIDMTAAVSVQILNLILRRSMEALKLQLVGRNFFDAVAKVDIPQHQLQLWPGYLTSIRQHENDIMLCAEVTNKVMRTETLYDILQNCVQNERSNFQIAYETAVLGMTVLTAYNNKTYRIDGIDFKMSPKETFDTRDGGKISFVQYYKDKYHLSIRDANQPLLVSKSKERDRRGGEPELILLVPELCRATGLTDNMRGDHRLMSAVAVYTRLAPKARIDRLNAFNQRLQNTAESTLNLKEWNFTLDKNMVQVNGRQLANEKIVFGNNKTAVTNHEADWSREFRNISMYTSQHLKNWVVIVPQRKRREAEDFIGILQRAGSGMRYEVVKPQIIDIPDDRGQTYSNALDQAFRGDPQLVMCIVLNNNGDKYSLIKKKCCVERAIPSQVMVVKTITPKQGKELGSLMSVGTKVAIQINSKLGGAPWMVEMPIPGLMVVGFDVCHDAKDKSKSYGALVASMDMKKAQNYFSAVTPHKNGEELSNQLALNIVKALMCFKGQHNALPERIVIYRDGVGEGQTNYVFEHEVKNILSKLNEHYGSAAKELKFSFIVVSKRINTRFFKGGINPNPGTVVDDIVTLPERFDFFLNSQYVRNGTVSPTNYNVLYDTSGLSPDRLQILSYKMTHLYYNWSGTLAVPAVCQYAHKLAFLVGNFIHQSPSNILEKQLYFL
ncbi:protein aubergine-like [Bradysia coprophila]|uniref:protein aubergine-like n=1 Tax=Bradysia coprophila TaxID=38358 RepID=UPI00187DAF1F|nr:protein aubergine-like [Bradysia coprophila]